MTRHPLALPLMLALSGCASPSHLTSLPAGTLAGPAVHATRVGATLTIDEPAALPADVRAATDLKAAVGPVKVPVSRLASGDLAFTLPAGVTPPQDVDGNMQVLFVLDDARSRLVALATGSPVRFQDPAVTTEPADGTIAFGLDAYMSAATAADEARYRFNWSAATSAEGPWQPVPGEGKRVKWTPTQPGNYFIRVEAVDRASQHAYGATTRAAAVLVTTPKDILTTTPASGALARGEGVVLHFNRPGGLAGSQLTYAWSEGPSAQGPWTPITGQVDPHADHAGWLPTELGSYFVRLDVSDAATGNVATFVSPQAVVFVTESQPVVTAEKANVLRGDALALAFNVKDAGPGPFAWYVARSSSPATTDAAPSLAAGAAGWVPLVGTGKAIATVATDAGSYHFRVDVPQPDGSVKSFVTAHPVVSVREPAPIIHTVPAFDSFEPGGSTTIALDAAAIDPARYHLVWSVSANPAGGFSALPFDAGNGWHAKSYYLSSQTSSTLPPAAYYVRVDATADDGSATYAFVSSAPAFNLTRAKVR